MRTPRPLRLSGRAGSLGLPALLLATALSAQQPRTVTGVVVDLESGAAVADVTVRIDGTALQGVTDVGGRFRLDRVPVGAQRLVLRHIAYGEHSRPLVVGDVGALEFRVRISRQAIELEPIEVEVRSDPFGDRRSSGNVGNAIERPTIDLFALRGETLVDILGTEMPGVRVNGDCVEYRLQTRTGGVGTPENDRDISTNCRRLNVYLDGTRVDQSQVLLLTLSLSDLERIQLLSPSEAGVRYGAAGQAVLLLETRQGTVPDGPRPGGVNVTGFGWTEPGSYPWARVLGTSFAANAAATGVAILGMSRCWEDSVDFGFSSQCSGVFALGSGMLTGSASSVLTRWAGGTRLSRGRTMPSLAGGMLTATTGYLLLLVGENRGSQTSRTAGLVVLTVGTPLVLTMADRVFRQLR